MSDPQLHWVAALMGDASRAAMLVHLMGGRHLPASELARIARVAPATASEHLAKLVEGGLIQVQRHGRHRYFALASPEVAQVVEGLLSLAPVEPVRSLNAATHQAQLRAARTCYHHLAGTLGTGLTDAMIRNGWLVFDPIYETLTLTEAGTSQAAVWGWHLDPTQRTPLVKPCLDWSERRFHAAGQVGREMAAWMFTQGWVTHLGSGRVVRVSDQGRQALAEWFGLAWPPAHAGRNATASGDRSRS